VRFVRRWPTISPTALHKRLVFCRRVRSQRELIRDTPRPRLRVRRDRSGARDLKDPNPGRSLSHHGRIEVVEFHHNSLDHYFMTASRTRFEHVQDQRLSLGGDAHCEWQAIRGAILPLRNPSPCDHPISYLTRHRVPVIRPCAIAIKTKKRLSEIAIVYGCARLVDASTGGIFGTEYGGCFKCPR